VGEGRGQRCCTSSTLRTTTTAPSGSFQVIRSPSTSTPAATPTTGVRYVTLEAASEPHSTTTRMFQAYASPVPSTPSATSASTGAAPGAPAGAPGASSCGTSTGLSSRPSTAAAPTWPAATASGPCACRPVTKRRIHAKPAP
jgi:hypothetical protein